jgi:hypothetical protein
VRLGLRGLAYGVDDARALYHLRQKAGRAAGQCEIILCMTSNGWFQAQNTAVPVAAVPWSLYDVVYHFAAWPTSAGAVNMGYITPSEIAAFKASKPAGKKLLLTLKDDTQTPDLSAFQHATSPGLISTFVPNIVNFVNVNGYDGVSIDWEQNVIPAQYVDLLNRLRISLPASKLLMMDGGDWGGLPGVASDCQKILNGVNVMCYAMSNGDNTETLFDAMTLTATTGLRSIASRMANFSATSPARLFVGIPFFCVRWAGASQPFVRGSFPPPVSQNYQDLVKDPAWQPSNQRYNVDVSGAYITVATPAQFIPYVSADQIAAIGKWAAAQGYAGLSAFCLSFDVPNSFPLGQAVKAAVTPAPVPITYAAPVTQPNGDLLFKKLT